MTKPKFNSPELYLLKNWANARLLEDSVEKVREKYKDLFSEVLDRVNGKHKELNCRGMRLDDDGGYVNVGLGRETWPASDHRWPSGLWIGGVALDDLASEEGEAPYAAVWISPPKGGKLDLKGATRTIEAEAKRLKLEVCRCEDDDGIEWTLPESRQELLALLEKEDSRGFIECMVAHFELLTRFTDVLNQVFDAKRKRK